MEFFLKNLEKSEDCVRKPALESIHNNRRVEKIINEEKSSNHRVGILPDHFIFFNFLVSYFRP